MIIDSHAYCFAAADSLMGYDSVAEHLRWAQAGQAGHYQPAFSLRDRSSGSSEALAPDGTDVLTGLPDVDFRIDHAAGRVVWTIDGEEKDFSPFKMIRETHRLNGENTLSAYHDNAAVLRGATAKRFFPNPDGNQYAYHEEPIDISIKVETHNHPTAISPFPGAATGSGGEIRDEGATGRGGKPKAGLTGFSVSHLRLPGLPRRWEQSESRPARISSALQIATNSTTSTRRSEDSVFCTNE